MIDQREQPVRNKPSESQYSPSPREIEECCRQIRQGWSNAEYRKRAGVSSRHLLLAVTPYRVSPGGHGSRD